MFETRFYQRQTSLETALKDLTEGNQEHIPASNVPGPVPNQAIEYVQNVPCQNLEEPLTQIKRCPGQKSINIEAHRFSSLDTGVAESVPKTRLRPSNFPTVKVVAGEFKRTKVFRGGWQPKFLLL